MCVCVGGGGGGNLSAGESAYLLVKKVTRKMKKNMYGCKTNK